MVAGVGRTLIVIGVLILLFVAYQLWGTGISEARDQSRLKKEFKTQTANPVVTPTAEVPVGDAVAIINIPKNFK